jgi:amino-acid N-acetyltransferase
MKKKKTKGPVFRSAVVDDVPAIHKLINKFARRERMLARSLGELYEMVRDFVVCEQNGRVVGCGAIRVFWSDLAEIKAVAVDGRYKQRGYGRMIIEQLHQEAKRCGVKRTFVLTFVPEFFGKLGYQEVEKGQLPHKIWSECVKCPQFPDCKEVAMVREVENE